MRSTCGHAGICGCRLGAPPKMAVRTPPAPDWREMARALAEALRKHRDPWPCAIRAIAPDEQDSARFNFICGDCCNRGVSPVFKHTKKCCVSFDAALLAEYEKAAKP